MNLMQMLQMIRQNPMQLLGQRFQIPQGMTQDPSAILQHLMSTGQVTQQQVNSAIQSARQMGIGPR